MTTKSDLRSRSGDTAFILVVGAAYLSSVLLLAYAPWRPPLVKLPLLVIMAAAYLLIGIYGFARCRKDGSLQKALLYSAVQLALAVGLLYVSRVPTIALIMLPLASQCVVLLPTRWLIAVCGVMVAVCAAPLWLRSGPGAAVVVGSVYLAFLVSVVAFTYVAVKERKARTNIESLATELGEANLKLREYSAKIEELATTKERNRLAREIHDSLGHYLTIINIQLEAAQAVMETDRAQARAALKKAQSLAQEGLVDVRQSVAALRTSPAEDRPLPQAIGILVDEICANGVVTTLSVEGNPQPLHPQITVTLYRAAQEGLTNIRKHARAASASILLDYRNVETVTLVLRDDGIGSADDTGGFGLLGMRERAQLLGGTVRIETAPGRGFMLTVKLPR